MKIVVLLMSYDDVIDDDDDEDVGDADSAAVGVDRILFLLFRSFGNFVHPTLPQFTQLHK